MRNILIVGAGQSGLQLGLSLLTEGYRVTIMAARTPEEIRGGWIMSSQVMFDQALATERAYGLDLWQSRTPQIAGLQFTLSAPPGERALEVRGRLDAPAQSVDQRLKMATWLELFEQRGGIVLYQGVTTADLDGLTRLKLYDLTIVAAGKGELVSVFDRDPERSPYTAPQRGLAVVYVNGLAPDPQWTEPSGSFNAVPGLGELFVIPAFTLSGPCDILFWETVPDGPLDRWKQRMEPEEQLKQTLELAREYAPWIYERCAEVELTDARAALSGRYTPTVRRPVAELPSGGLVLGMADVVVANDPVTGQGSNTAAKCAAAYLAAILARGDRPFDREWMQVTFDGFWERTGRHVTAWTNAMLQPWPEHVPRLLGAASTNETVARRFANGFSDPADFEAWFMSPAAAASYLAEVSANPATA
jgi:2-polyprenyl-6-methoxyphenol hydroxylase-like FAD-dependent oxidoreductase